jgi:hypothetical protein
MSALARKWVLGFSFLSLAVALTSFFKREALVSSWGSCPASTKVVELERQRGDKHPSGNGKILVHLGLEAGDQPADAWAVIDKDGNILVEESGCGEGTPRPFETLEGWNFSSDLGVQMREQSELNARNKEAFRIGWSTEWANVANHIRSCYLLGQNPLKGLRRKFPGTWKYLVEGNVQADSAVGEIRFTELSQAENEITEAPNYDYPDFWANVWNRWQVSYIPAK